MKSSLSGFIREHCDVVACTALGFTSQGKKTLHILCLRRLSHRKHDDLLTSTVKINFR